MNITFTGSTMEYIGVTILFALLSFVTLGIAAMFYPLWLIHFFVKGLKIESKE